jgi:hypothetical protein
MKCLNSYWTHLECVYIRYRSTHKQYSGVSRRFGESNWFSVHIRPRPLRFISVLFPALVTYPEDGSVIFLRKFLRDYAVLDSQKISTLHSHCYMTLKFHRKHKFLLLSFNLTHISMQSSELAIVQLYSVAAPLRVWAVLLLQKRLAEAP